MNTEVSVNPGIEIDLRVFSGINGTNNIHYVHPQSGNPSNYNGRLTRLRSNVMRQPSGPVGPPPAIVHVSSSRKDIPALPSIQVNSVKSMSSSNELELPRHMDQSPTLSPNASRDVPPSVFSSFQGTQISYPRVSFHSDLRYDPPPPPLRSPRGRSPHDIPRSPSHVNGEVAVSHGHHMQQPVPMKEDPPENPTVYVLPNDFDLNGGYDSHFQAYGPMSHDDVRRHEEMRRQEELRRHEEMRRQREARRQEEPPRLDEAELLPPKRSKPEPMPSFALPTQVSILYLASR